MDDGSYRERQRETVVTPTPVEPGNPGQTPFRLVEAVVLVAVLALAGSRALP